MNREVKWFNLRVYGIWIKNDCVLLVDEPIRGQPFTKFPGGGLELGEGLRAGLQREMQEELESEFLIGDHFYTTDDFIPSRFDESQLISVYYRMEPAYRNLPPQLPHTNANGETFRWCRIDELDQQDKLQLPVDIKVAGMLMDKN